MDELGNAKSIIRSMLISEPSQRMTLREIARRHREDEGTPVPYLKFGFKSPEQFFRSITDTVQISGYGDEAVLQPVINKEVSHIQSLILRQRPPRSKGRQRFRNSGPLYDNRSQPRPQYFNPNYNQNSGGFSQKQYSPPKPQNQVKDHRPGQTDHKSSNGIDTSPRQSTNARKEEVYLPPSLYEKLFQIVCDDPGQPIHKFESSVKIKHPFLTGIFPNVTELINAVDRIHISNGCVYVTNKKDTGQLDRVAESLYASTASMEPKIPAGMESDSDHEMFDDAYYQLGAKELTSSKPSTELDASEIEQKAFDIDAAHERLSPAEISKERCISTDLKNKLTELLQHYSTGIWCSMLPEIFQKYYQVNLDSRSSGFSSLIEMMKSCPETIVCVQENGSWKVSNAKVSNTKATPGCVPDFCKENIKQLLVKYPNGIHIDAFSDLYERLYATPLNCHKMNFNNIDDMCLSINNTVIKMKITANRFIILPLENDKPQNVSTTLAVKAESGLMGLFPSDCIRPGFEFTELVLPKKIETERSLTVIVASVASLDNFYVNIRDTRYSGRLNDLGDQMAEFYEANPQKYRMPPEAMVPGAVCVTITFGEYSRCIISAEKDSNTIAVVPVDYGCTTSAKKKDLFFLHKDFAQLPQQAVYCRCANLVPPFNETSFKRKAVLRFLELVNDKGLFAYVAQYDLQRNFLSLSLTDTTGDNDLHISDQLCLEGHAMFKMDNPITEIPLVKVIVKWEPPAAPKEEPAHQVEEQKIEEPKQADRPELSQELQGEPSNHVRTPPGFKSLPLSEKKTNSAWAKIPNEGPEQRFLDLDQLLAINKLATREPATQEMYPSPASLKESHNEQEPKTSFAQLSNSAYSPREGNSMAGTLELSGPGARKEFLSLEQPKLSAPIKATGYGHLSVSTRDSSAENRVGRNEWHTNAPEFFSRQQREPMNHAVGPPISGFLAPQGRPNSANPSDSYSQSRTVQVEFSLSELHKLTDQTKNQLPPRNKSLPMPPHCQAAPHNYRPLWPIFQRTPQYRNESQNFMPMFAVQGQPVLPPRNQFDLTSQNLGLLQTCEQNPPARPAQVVTSQVTDLPSASGMAFYPPRVATPQPVLMSGMQAPYPPSMSGTQFCKSFEHDLSNASGERNIASPNFKWNQYTTIRSSSVNHVQPAPKKTLTICSPTSLEVKNIPHKGELPLQTDLCNGASNGGTQVTSSLKNDLTEVVKTDNDSFSGDSLDDEALEDSQALLPAENGGIEGKEEEKNGATGKFDLEDESELQVTPEEFEDSEVRPQSSTSVLEMPESLEDEQQLENTNDAKDPSTEKKEKKKKPSSKRHFIIKIDVAGTTINVIWIGGFPYLEVDPLLSIGELRPPVALKVIKSKNIHKKLCEIKAKTHPALFEDMVKLGMARNGKLLLVQLYDVGELLSCIDVSDAAYMNELHEKVYTHRVQPAQVTGQ